MIYLLELISIILVGVNVYIEFLISMYIKDLVLLKNKEFFS